MGEKKEKIINLTDLFNEADESLKDFIYRILTDHISLEDLMGDIIAIYFCKQEKISHFQGTINTRLSFDRKIQILKQILKIEKPNEDKPEIIKKIEAFTDSQNDMAHTRRGFSISKDGLTVHFDRYKDGKYQNKELTENDRNELQKLGKECVDELIKIREEMKKKYFS